MPQNSGLMRGNRAVILGVFSDYSFVLACHSVVACDIARAE
jgi:hypothetical protein